MNIEQEIRDQIENIKKLKQEVGYINNHLSILEGFCQQDKQKWIDDAYEDGFRDGKKEKENIHDANVRDAWERGRDAAWEAARKLFSSMADSDIEKAFPIEWNNGGFNALMNLQPQEAIEKLKAYEEKQEADSIKVGDCVCEKQTDPRDFGVVTWASEDSCYVMWKDGSSGIRRKELLCKTGKHYDIQSILEAMRT